MPINQLATLSSHSNPPTNAGATWFSTFSRQDAINGAITLVQIQLPGITRNAVQSFPSQFPYWPELKHYPADSSPNPQYVWNVSQPPDAPTNGPGTLFFAQVFEIPATVAPGAVFNHLATAEVFCDNNASLYIDEILVTIPGVGDPTIVFLNNIVNGTINGSLSDAGQAAAPPFGWQTISNFSKAYTTTFPNPLPTPPEVTLHYFFAVSFEAVNYSPNGSPDPAGLQFIAKLFEQTSAT